MAYTNQEHAAALELALAAQKKELCAWYGKETLNRVQQVIIKSRIKIYLAFVLGIVFMAGLTIAALVYIV